LLKTTLMYVMSDEELLTKFKAYRDRVGKAKALSGLTARDVGPTTADRLVRDDYKGKPRRKLRAALIALVQEKAS
jgi:hypothetical protein